MLDELPPDEQRPSGVVWGAIRRRVRRDARSHEFHHCFRLRLLKLEKLADGQGQQKGGDHDAGEGAELIEVVGRRPERVLQHAAHLTRTLPERSPGVLLVTTVVARRRARSIHQHGTRDLPVRQSDTAVVFTLPDGSAVEVDLTASADGGLVLRAHQAGLQLTRDGSAVVVKPAAAEGA